MCCVLLAFHLHFKVPAADCTWFVDHVVDPPLALLYSQPSPLVLGHQVGGGHQFRQLLGKHHMPEKNRSPPSRLIKNKLKINPFIKLHRSKMIREVSS